MSANKLIISVVLVLGMSSCRTVCTLDSLRFENVSADNELYVGLKMIRLGGTENLHMLFPEIILEAQNNTDSLVILNDAYGLFSLIIPDGMLFLDYEESNISLTSGEKRFFRLEVVRETAWDDIDKLNEWILSGDSVGLRGMTLGSEVTIESSSDYCVCNKHEGKYWIVKQ